MDRTMDFGTARAVRRPRDAAYQGYQILHWGFVAAPTIAGLDKFAHVLTNWDQYLAPAVERVLPFSGHTFMLLVGVIELIAAMVVAVKPRIGAWVVAAWLGGIIVNLLVLRGYYDIALRDFGLMLAAIALGRLASLYDRPIRT
jgi:hypothetical protein